MIKSLKINNLVLVDASYLEFEPHFTALTGETGAGKTALIEAIHLAMGARADTNLIRNGAEKAFVEVSFDTASVPQIHSLLDEAGIAYDPGEELIVRREISREGKNRAFIQCQMVPLPLLQKVGSVLLELIGQHSHQGLAASDFQRAIIDRYGNLSPLLSAFQKAWEKEKTLQSRLNSLLQTAAQREREEETIRLQLEEIGSISLEEGEEERLSQEHKRLFHTQEIREKTEGLLHLLSSLLPQINRSVKLCEAILNLDPSAAESHGLLAQSSIALVEAERELERSLDRLDVDPQQCALVEEKIAALHRLKRKYGPDLGALAALQTELSKKLDAYSHLAESIEEVESELAQAQEVASDSVRILTEERKKAAERLSHCLTVELQSLNMPHAEIKIAITPHTRTFYGEDLVQFWIRPNQGEQAVLVKEHASGGELSRLLFALKIVLAEKNDTPTLIFDEIDANVGGQTASMIGQKLRALGACRQILCITHFPQVASQAEAHIAVKKVEREGRTVTQIQTLTPPEKEQELLRMLGGASNLPMRSLSL